MTVFDSVICENNLLDAGFKVKITMAVLYLLAKGERA